MSIEKLREDMVVFRAKKRMSQTDLAKACGISLQTVNSVENGTQTPSKVTLEKIKLVIYEKES